jgi:fibronectin-binding autotransporter adhesin
MKVHCGFVSSAVAVALTCALLSAPSQGASLYWDTVSGGALTGGSGSWSGNNWATSSSGGALGAFSNGANIYFQDTTGTFTDFVSNTAARTIGSITVDDDNSVTLDNTAASGLENMTVNGPITVQGGGSLTINLKNWTVLGTPNTVIQAGSALNFTFSSNISTARTFTLGAVSFGSGGGTLGILNSAAVTSFGVSATDLSGDNSDAINLGTSTSHPSTLTINTADNLSTYNGAILGTGNLVKSGPGLMTLSGVNTYSGSTAVSGGTLALSGAGVLGGGYYTAAIANNGSLVMNTSSNQTLAGAISGSGAFIQQGSGVTTLAAPNTYSGPTVITSGTLALGAAAAIPQSPAISLGNAATLDISAQANFHLLSGQSLLGTGSYLVNGALTANSGSMILPGGTTSAGSLNIGALTLSTGCVLNYDLGSGQDLINVTSPSGLTLNGGGFYLYQPDGMTPFGATGTYPLIDFSGAVGPVGNLSVLNPIPGETYTFAANGGVLSVNISNPVTWTAGGSPSFNWSNSANWSGLQAPANGQALAFSGTTGLASTNDISNLSLTGLIFTSSAGAFNLSGNSIQLSGAIANNSPATQTIGMDIALASGNQSINAAAGNIVLGGVVSDGGAGLGLNITGTAVVVLGAANTYSGPTNLTAGTLCLAHPLAVQSSTVNLAGGVLAFPAGITSPALGGLSGSGNLTLATAASESVTLTVGGNGQNTTYAGSLSGPGGLVKQGGGIVTLTTAQSYSGPTSIAGGTLQLLNIGAGIGIQFQGNGTPISGSDGAFPISHWNVLTGETPSGSNLMNSSGVATTASLVTSGGNSGTTTSGSTIPLLSGYVYKQAGTITVTISGIPYANYSLYAYSEDSTAGHTDTLTVGGTTYYFTAESDSTFDPITNTNSALNPLGNYAVTAGLSGASQTVTISSPEYTGFCGFEIVNTANASLPAATSVTISNGATLDMTNDMQTIASLSSTDGMGSQVLLGAGVLTITGPAVTTFDGVISGMGGSLVLQGGGLTLTGANAYTGATTVSGGTLQLNSGFGPAVSGNLTVSGGTVQLLQSNQIASTANISVSAGLLNIGAAGTSVNGVQITGGTIAGTTGALTSATNYDAQSGAVSATLAGNAGLNKTTSGTVVLSAPNTYTGVTNLSAGTLVLGHPLAVQDSTIDMTGGALSFAQGVVSPMLGGLEGGGNVLLATAAPQGAAQPVALNVGGNGQGTIYGGSLSGPGSLIKQGPGTLAFTSTQSYSGPTLISGGVLQLLPFLASGGNLGIGIHFVGSGSGQTGAAGVIPVSNWNNFTTVNPANQALIDSTGAATTATLTVIGATNNNGASHSSIQVLNGYNYTNVTGSSMSVTISGIPYPSYSIYAYVVDSAPDANDEQMTLGGQTYYYSPDGGQTLNPTTNTYYNQITNTTPGTYPVGNYVVATGLTGVSQTVVSAGAQLNASGKEYGTFASFELVDTAGLPAAANLLPTATPVTISNGGTLDMTNVLQTIASLSSTDGMGSQVLVGSGALTIAGTAVTTFDGTISGAGGSLILDGGALALTGTNTFTGGTWVEAGTLIVDSNAGLADGSSLIVGQEAPALFAPDSADPSVAPVPEPDVFALLAASAVGLFGLRYRMSRRASRRATRSISSRPRGPFSIK